MNNFLDSKTEEILKKIDQQLKSIQSQSNTEYGFERYEIEKFDNINDLTAIKRELQEFKAELDLF